MLENLHKPVILTGSQLPIGVISGFDNTTEAAVTKMMYLFAKDYEQDETAKLLRQDLRGEMSPF